MIILCIPVPIEWVLLIVVPSVHAKFMMISGIYAEGNVQVIYGLGFGVRIIINDNYDIKWDPLYCQKGHRNN